jgi:hypothetical protein
LNTRKVNISMDFLTKHISLIGFIAFVSVGVFLVFFRGSIHDYVAYERQWYLINSGYPDLATDNVYGPIHFVLAYLWSVNSLAPKLIMFLLLSISFAPLFYRLAHTETKRTKLLFFCLLPFNFLTLSISGSFGLNDTLVAAFVLACILSYAQSYFKLAGILLGLAILVKIYPLVFLPFLGLRNRKLIWPLLYSSILTVLIGYSLAFYIWQKSVVSAFLFGIERDPKYFNYLGSWFYRLNRQYDSWLSFLSDWNAYVCVIALLLLFVLFFLKRFDSIATGFIAFLILMTLYKGSSQQYFLPWVSVWGYMLLVKNETTQRLASFATPYVCFLSMFALGYEIFSAYFSMMLIREYVGFFTLLLGSYVVGNSIKVLLNKNSGS